MSLICCCISVIRASMRAIGEGTRWRPPLPHARCGGAGVTYSHLLDPTTYGCFGAASWAICRWAAASVALSTATLA
jgi:hypothetical protein